MAMLHSLIARRWFGPQTQWRPFRKTLTWVGAWRYGFGLARRGSTIGFHLLWQTEELPWVLVFVYHCDKFDFCVFALMHWLSWKKKVREKSRESHNRKPQPFPDPRRKRKPTNLNKHKPNKRTKSTKISSLFPKRGNRNTKKTEKHKNILANDTR